MKNRESVASALALFGATFDRKISPEVVKAYALALRDLSDAELAAATQRGLRECKFMPSPAELRELVGRKHDDEAAAVISWQAVRAAIDKHDYLVASIDFGPLVNAVIRNLGGWDTLCRATLPELDSPGWLRKRFEEVYAALAISPASSLRGEPLEGNLPRDYRGAGAVVVAIGGENIAPRIATVPTDAAGVSETIRALAESKAVTG